MVRLKHDDLCGFVFYSHTTNPKGRDLAANPRTVLCRAFIEQNSNTKSASKAGSKPPRPPKPMRILRRVHD
jgi:pyridoxine/pyridoxamine 5'-phosphate oxidase